MSFGERLKSARNEKKYTQSKLAELLGYGSSTISEYEKGNNNPNLDIFIKICKVLNRDANYFLQDDIKGIRPQINPEYKKLIEQYYNLTSHDKKIVDYILNIEESQQYPDNVIRLIDMGEIIPIDTYIEPVSAGDGNIVMTGECVSKLYPSTQISSKASYCARISGDSMNPVYLNGDIVYVDSEEIPTHNSIGIFQYHGNSYCKKYYAQNNIEKLISLNPDQDRYPPIIIEDDSLIKQGRVIGKFHAD